MPTSEHLRRSAAAKRPRGRIGRLLAILGPGLVSGAADDDPAGLVTSIQAGAKFQYALAWTSVIQFPLLAALQMTAARIGMITGRDFTRVLALHYSRRLLWAVCLLLLIANTLTAGADLAGAAAGVELLTHIPRQIMSIVLAIGLPAALVFGRYHLIAAVLKWTTLVLLAYILAGVLANPQWGQVVHATFVPTFHATKDYLSLFVAVFGGTISPYLLVWQSAQEVEELREAHKKPLLERPSSARRELKRMRQDTIFGMAISQAITYFVIIAAAAVIFPSGVHDVESARQAATSLRPIGSGAGEVLFSIGIFGSGLIGVATLTGSSAYAIAAAANWPVGVNKKPHQARGFYAILVAGALVAGGIAVSSQHPMSLLVFSQIINGLLAPPLLLIILHIANNRRIVGSQRNGAWLNVLGGATFFIMAVPAVWLLVLTAAGK